MLERDREVKNAGEGDNRGKSVQRIGGCRDDAWTMDNKKKRKRKRKGRRGGREEEKEEEGPLEKRLGGPRGSLYIPSRIFRHGREGGTEYLVVTGVWIGELNWFGDLPPSGPIYKSAVASSL